MAARAARRGSRDPGPIVPQRPSRSAWMRQPKEPHLLMTQSRQELRSDALAITMAAHRPGTPQPHRPHRVSRDAGRVRPEPDPGALRAHRHRAVASVRALVRRASADVIKGIEPLGARERHAGRVERLDHGSSVYDLRMSGILTLLSWLGFAAAAEPSPVLRPCKARGVEAISTVASVELLSQRYASAPCAKRCSRQPAMKRSSLVAMMARTRKWGPV